MIDYNIKYKVDTRIARIFNTYRPRMDKNDGRVVSNFINQALTNQNITLYGKGDQTRSFCYIEDQIDGLIKLMNTEYFYPINIGNPHEITVKELAENILKLTCSKSSIAYCLLPLDDPTNRKPNIKRAKIVLGWESKYELESGLKKTIEYLKSL